MDQVWSSITVRFAVRLWTRISLNSAIVAEDVSVSISAVKRGLAQNLIPTTLGIITVRPAWTISFFAEDVANTGREEAVFL
jgi:hypothetical protein